MKYLILFLLPFIHCFAAFSLPEEFTLVSTFDIASESQPLGLAKKRFFSLRYSTEFEQYDGTKW
jgi:hypothetical protein